MSMPTASKPRLDSAPSIRRSSRISKLLQGKQDDASAIEEPSPPKRRKEAVSACNKDNLLPVEKMHNSSNPVRSQRITPDELLEREKALLRKEREYKRMSGELQERVLCLSRKEETTFLMMSQLEDREAQTLLAQLEDHFTCTLCYEIMAHPHTINSVQCGHTFCAICILKWFFTRLHRDCGRWHEAVECPICRSPFVLTPDQVPRPEITFPFLPNRTAAAVCKSLIENLARSQADLLDVKRALKSKSKAKNVDSRATTKMRVSNNAEVTAWSEGGYMRAEWLKRDREGKEELNYILKSWATLKSEDFLTLKQKFGSHRL